MSIGKEIKALIQHDDLRSLESSIVEHGINSIVGDSDSRFIHYAAAAGSISALRLCISYGADVSAEQSNGSTPLMLAVLSQNKECISELIERGADINSSDDQGVNSLMFASGFGWGSMVMRAGDLAWCQCLPNREDRSKACLNKLNEQFGLNRIPEGALYSRLASQAQEQYDAEMHATQNFRCQECSKHREIAELLIDAGAEVNPDNASNYGHMATPLHCALFNGHIEIAELLIARGASVNQRGIGDEPPLCTAASAMDFGAVKMLVEAGAEVDCHDTNGQSPLSLAIYRRRNDIADFLTSQSSRLNDDGIALIRAAQTGDANRIERLLQNGVQVDYVDKDGKTPLMYACAHLKKDAVYALIRAGADVDYAGPDGVTAMHEAFDSVLLSGFGIPRDGKEWQKTDIVEMLCMKGANVDADSVFGTPLNCAIVTNNASAIRVLSEYGAALNGHFVARNPLSDYYHENIALWLLEEELDHAFCKFVEFCPRGVNSLLPDGIENGAGGINFLTYAAQLGRLDCIAYLVNEQAVHVDFANAFGATPLMIALASGKVRAADLLINLGASPFAKDHNGNDIRYYAIIYAQRSNDLISIEWIRRKGFFF